MSEKQFKLDYNGQQVQQQDFTLIGETSGLADDRVFAELFRMAPINGSTVSKGILPMEYGGWPYGLMTSNGATGSVLVTPFRAFVGSRTAQATDARKYMRDIRSGLSVVEGANNWNLQVIFASNSSGNNRYDLVYAAVAVGANGTSTTRKVKDPTTKVVSDQSVSVYSHTSVTLGVVQGTPSATPVWPSLPADSGSTYYVPIGYVRIPNGFNTTSTVGVNDIAIQAPVLRVSSGVGAMSLKPSTSNYILSAARQATFGNSSARPSFWIPPDLSGGQVLLIALDLLGSNTALWSHTNGAIIDDSRDWRNRITKWTACVADSTKQFEWNYGGAGTLSNFPGVNAYFTPDTDTRILTGLGTTILSANGADVGRAVYINGAALGVMDNLSNVFIYPDLATGYLRISIDGEPNCRLFIWLELTGGIPNR